MYSFTQKSYKLISGPSDIEDISCNVTNRTDNSCMVEITWKVIIIINSILLITLIVGDIIVWLGH